MEEIIKDNNLSWKAKGIYFALKEIIENERCSSIELKSMSSDGIHSTSKGVKELIENGYLTREMTKNGARYSGSKWILNK